MPQNIEEDKWCENCDVHLSLHVNDGSESWDCELADRKADMIDSFFGAFFKVVRETKQTN